MSNRELLDKRIDFLDLLRGYAILAVMLVHTAQTVSGLPKFISVVSQYAQMGVQLFFVVSAYSLCLTWRSHEKEPAKYLGFYIRRFFRLAPLYYVAILLYFFVHMKSGDYGHFSDYLAAHVYEVFTNIFFLHGLIPEANNTVVPGGWSIGAEVLFYALFPFLFSLLVFSYDKWRMVGVLIVVFLLIILLFVFECFSFDRVENNSFEYYSIVNQLPVFMIGMAIFVAFELEGINRGSAMVNFFCFIGLTVVCMFIWKIKVFASFMLVPFLASLSFYFIFLLARSGALDVGLIKVLGICSYSAYIFHFIVIGFVARPLIDFFDFDLPAILNLVLMLILVIPITYLISMGSHRVIEVNGINLGRYLLNYIIYNKYVWRR